MIDVKEHIARNARIGSLEEYQKLYRESLEDPERFWSQQVIFILRIFLSTMTQFTLN